LDEPRVPRRLAAILAADVAGYSRLMGADEVGTIARLKALRRGLIDPAIREHRGRIVKTTGDGILIEFPSVVAAVECAAAVQRGMAEHNRDVPEERRIEFRVGVNLGDIIADGKDILGDGVNVAARLEALAEPGRICVSGTVRDQVRDKLPFDFADLGEQQLKNIARPVRVWRLEFGAPAPPRAMPALSDKPSIAVLPFTNMSGDPEQEYFADGMVEEIITGLARIKWLAVIARNSSFIYKGKPVDVKQVGREMGVRYVLEGSVRKAGGRVRITGQLIDAASGAHLWADRFEGALDDVFALQDEIAMRVLGAIEPSLVQAESERVRRKRPENLDAYDLVLRAAPFAHRLMPEDAAKAIPLLERAIELEPGYADAHGLLAFCYETRFVRAGLHEPDRAAAIGHARAALATGGDHATALALAGFVVAILEHDSATALDALGRAVALAPSSAVALTYSALIHVLLGETETGMEHAQRALRLSPSDPMNFPAHQALAYGNFALERYEEAANAARRAVRVNPGFSTLHTFLVAPLVLLGRTAEAQETAQRLLALEPAFTIGRLRFVRIPGVAESVKAKFTAALAAAGLPL
jgi:adenylate cyclase